MPGEIGWAHTGVLWMGLRGCYVLGLPDVGYCRLSSRNLLKAQSCYLYTGPGQVTVLPCGRCTVWGLLESGLFL